MSWPAWFCVVVKDVVLLARNFIERDGEFTEPARRWLGPHKKMPAF